MTSRLLLLFSLLLALSTGSARAQELPREVPLGLRSLEARDALDRLNAPELSERQEATDFLVRLAAARPEDSLAWLLARAYESADPERRFRLVEAIERICREEIYRAGSAGLGARLERVTVDGATGFRVLAVQALPSWDNYGQGDGSEPVLEEGDLLVEFGGVPFDETTGPWELEGLVARRQAGERVAVTVRRAGVELDLSLVLGPRERLQFDEFPPAVSRPPEVDPEAFVERLLRSLRDELRAARATSR